MSKIEAVDIRVNNFTDPVGINCEKPEISWRISNAASQSAWQLKAAASESDLENGNLLYDSGIVHDALFSGHIYAGPLESCRRTFFKVRLFDENNAPGRWSRCCFFETGFRNPDDFDAMWMGYPAGWAGNALFFRKKFLCESPDNDARLYVAAGVVVVFLNGVRVGGNSVLQPAQSDYSKSFHYLTYDVSHLLKAGENILTLHAGSGWYGMPVVKYMLFCGGRKILSSSALTPPEVCCSPVVSQSIYDGEVYEQCMETDPALTVPGSRAAMRVCGAAGVPRGLEEEPVTPVEEIAPVSWKQFSQGYIVVDFGRNFAGWCRLKLNSCKKQRVTMRFAEKLNSDGNINQDNLQSAKATDIFVSAGVPCCYEPEFTYHGFRYLEISGLAEEFTLSTVTGIVLRTSCRRRGYFTSSSELLNRIFEMMLHTEESNLFAIPTDCPQRAERMGWLNDMLARNEGANYLFDVSGIYSKYLRDIAEAQDEKSGEIPMTSPFYWALDIDPVCSSFVECAWNNFIFNGRKVQLAMLYDNMKKWFQCLLDNCDDDGIMRKGGFVGDWCPPLAFNGNIETPQNKNVPHGLVSTALIFYTAELMRKISGVLGRADDAVRFASHANKIKEDFLRVFRISAGRLISRSQTGYAIALYCGLFPEDECTAAAAELADIFEKNSFKHTTGNIGTKYLLDVLSKYGYADHVFELVSSEDYPGWGYMLANGATTVWERWEQDDNKRLNSLNHPMHSAPCSWIFRYLGGIRLTDESVASNLVELSPVFPAKLDRAETVFDSPAGVYRSEWVRKENGIVWSFEIPNGCRAKVKMPSGNFEIYGSGTYSINF